MTDRPMRVPGAARLERPPGDSPWLTPWISVVEIAQLKDHNDMLWDALSALVEDAHRHGHADPFILANAETVLEETNRP